MEDLIYLGKNPSEQYILNYLSNEDKIYFMDNHLAASWCWSQKINTQKQYNFLHIDAHNDLCDNNIDLWIEELKTQKTDFKNITIEKYLNLKFYNPSFQYKTQLFTWDNYLPIFLKSYPDAIKDIFFATHEKFLPIQYNAIKKIEIWDLQHGLFSQLDEEKEFKWIINLDIDYFFSYTLNSIGEKIYFQFLTDEYIIEIANQLCGAMDKIEVLTIALSPEMCRGWENSIRITRLIAKQLKININDSKLVKDL